MEKLLRQLLEITGVAAILLIGKDGLPVASMTDDARTEGHAAHAAATFEALTRYARQLHLGAPRQALFTTDSTTIALTEAGDMVLIVEARGAVNLGQIRRESLRIARALADQMRG
jgi:predicted regulator of Ras-like GTPase activity (Roadblock/LC7/MglB family)